MPDHKLKIEIDAAQIAEAFGEIRQDVEQALTDGVKLASSMAFTKANELANERLHQRREAYAKALSWNEVSKGLWTVELDESAMWIEDGRKCIIYTNEKDAPKVLTPNGMVKITKLEIGDRVLNQNGKWTKITNIYNDPLNTSIKVYPVQTCNFTPENFKLNKRINTKFLLRCSDCGNQRYVQKVGAKQRASGFCCETCVSRKKVVSISVSYLAVDEKPRGLTIRFTPDHKILTNKGWIEAKDITTEHTLKSPCWNKCKKCGDDTNMYTEMCSFKCKARNAQEKVLAAGKHVSQNPDFLANIYLKTIKNLKKISGSEEAVAGLFEKNGFSVGFYAKNHDNHYDFIRQYPVFKNDGSNGASAYYYIDFYSPRLGLAIEIDGPFHSKQRDHKRDCFLRSKGIETFRFSAKEVPKKNFWKDRLLPVVSNHTDKIVFRDLKILSVNTKSVKKFSNYRKFDLTVEEGESFVLEGFVVHNSGSMVDDLLRKNYKVNKKGEKYKVIPFDQGKAPSKLGEKGKQLQSQVKRELKARNIPYKKLELDSSGNPRLGLLHQIKDIQSEKPSKKAKHGALEGLSVYQTKDKTGNVRRDIMTFRVVKESHAADGRWYHPGLKPVNILDDVFQWVSNVFDNEILPEILSKFDK